MENLNIYQKISKIQNELQAVAKDLKISIGNGGYKAVGEGNILSAVKPLEQKYGVMSYPVSRVVVESGFVEKGSTKNYFERIETTYRFVNMDNPQEFIDTTSYGDGIDSGDKSVGKAMTYADKYALMKMYKIETCDDPDQNASEKYDKSTTKKFVLNERLQERCQHLDIPLNSIALWLKKPLVELTDDDLLKAIQRKEAKLEREKQ